MDKKQGSQLWFTWKEPVDKLLSKTVPFWHGCSSGLLPKLEQSALRGCGGDPPPTYWFGDFLCKSVVLSFLCKINGDYFAGLFLAKEFTFCLETDDSSLFLVLPEAIDSLIASGRLPQFWIWWIEEFANYFKNVGQAMVVFHFCL